VKHLLPFGVGTLGLASLLLAAAEPPAAPGPPQTFREILSTRPAARLDDLADRSAPDKSGDVASGSFLDLLQIRDHPTPHAVGPLIKVLESNVGGNRIHGFAAAQALSTARAPEAAAALDKHLLKPDYPVDLALMYTSGWEMPEPARTAFLDRYLLRSVGGGPAVRTTAAWELREGRRTLVVAVTLTNNGDKPIALMVDASNGAGRLHFRGPDGRVAPSEFGFPCLPHPRWVRLAPGASEQIEASALTLTPDREQVGRFRSVAPAPKAVLSLGGGAAVAVPQFGRYKVTALVWQKPIPGGAWGGFDPRELWVGRAASEPAEVEIREADLSQR